LAPSISPHYSIHDHQDMMSDDNQHSTQTLKFQRMLRNIQSFHDDREWSERVSDCVETGKR